MVIAIVALLLAILLPALGAVRQQAREVAESASTRQFEDGYSAYHVDYKELVVPAGPAWTWVHPGNNNPAYVLRPVDPFPARPLLMEGSVSKTWVWHFCTVSGFKWNTLIYDKNTQADFRNRPTQGTEGADGWAQYGADSAQAAIGFHPFIGMNGVYVGGSYSHGAFSGDVTNRDSQGRGITGMTNPGLGDFYIKRSANVRNPSELLLFVSSRGGDVREGGWWGYGMTPPGSGKIQPGYWLVTPPKAYPMGRGMNAPTSGPAWDASNRFDARRNSPTWGNIDFRYGGRAVTGRFDGSVKSQSIEQLRDMRKWSNYADNADWNFRGR